MIDMNEQYLVLDIRDLHVPSDVAVKVMDLLSRSSVFILEDCYSGKAQTEMAKFPGETYPKIPALNKGCITLHPPHLARLALAKSNFEILQEK